MLKLYDYELSGNCYKVRLLIEFLGLAVERIPVEFYPAQEHKTAWFLAINPLGQLPVIDDDGLILRDAQAILVYLASKYDDLGRWYPRDSAELLGDIQMWLSFAADLNGTVALARLHDSFFHDCDVAHCRAAAHRLFRLIDQHLWFAEQIGQDWLCSPTHPTIADIACFPYIMLSEEGGVSRLPYPAIRRWTDRVKRIPRFTLMPGIFFASALPA
ncbi:MAG TPA: glutathione S-transferase [Steroidobacteraceae bacterium]|nr:glutathione S-transferase [Steroidobacteraceae bacterium]